MTISNKTGSPVTGDDFFDRKWEFDRLIHDIKAGNQILISAPRRVGKSSLMKKVLAWARQQAGWNRIEVNVEYCKNEADFLDSLVQGLASAGASPSALSQLAQKTTDLRNWFSGIKLKGPGVGIEFGDAEQSDWKETTDLFDQALQKMTEKNRLLIGVDELPVFLLRLMKDDPEKGLARVGLILHWLRGSRQQNEERIVWLFCGSIGLDGFVQRHRLVETINDLTLVPLGAFSQETAGDFLTELAVAENLPLSAETIDDMLDLIGWPLPYFLQLLFHAIKDLPPDQRSQEYPGPADVQSAQQLLVSASYANYFMHWVTRLREQLSAPDADASELLLKQLCRHKRGLSRNKLLQLLLAKRPSADPEQVEQQLSLLLDLLERDGYLQREKSIYFFRSFLLREFWKNRT